MGSKTEKPKATKPDASRRGKSYEVVAGKSVKPASTGCDQCDTLVAAGHKVGSYYHEQMHETPKQKVEKSNPNAPPPVCGCDGLAVLFSRQYGDDRGAELARGVCPVHKEEAARERQEAQDPGEPKCEPLEPRSNDSNLLRITAPAGKCPVPLADGKWATIREWAEAVRAHYEEVEGKFLTVDGLSSWVDSALGGGDYDRVLRIRRRLHVVCAQELRRERSHARAVAASAAAPKEAEPEAAPVVGAPATPKVSKKPGVCKRIVAMLEEATKAKPVTREQIAAKLAVEFPERDPKGMRATAFNAASWILTEQKREVLGTKDGGWWLPPKK